MNSRAIIAFVPREVFSTTEKCLRRLYEATREPFDLVVVDGNSDRKTSNFLKAYSKEKGFSLIRHDRILPPNHARNIAFRWAREKPDVKYIVFVDNDALVSDGWLDALLKCADETGAGLVGPAYFEHLPEHHQLHMYGGTCGVQPDESGRTTYYELHDCQHLKVADLESPLERKKTELIEFHTVLVRMDLLEKINGLDERLLCTGEHADLSMMALQNGYEIWMEPESKITYAPPKGLLSSDKAFFFQRWSEVWMKADQEHFMQKWNIEYMPNTDGRGFDWTRTHRHYGYKSLLKKVRKIVGRKLSNKFERKVFRRFEPKWNKLRFPNLS